MLENSLSQLEGHVRTLVEENRVLLSANAQLATELASFKEENETLQLSALEQDDQQSATLARIQALVALAGGESSRSPVSS
jgi:regulator of replication initiation timing